LDGNEKAVLLGFSSPWGFWGAGVLGWYCGLVPLNEPGTEALSRSCSLLSVCLLLHGLYVLNP
jgi:hypothetical protein